MKCHMRTLIHTRTSVQSIPVHGVCAPACRATSAKPRGRITFICRADRVPELISLFHVAGACESVLYPLWPRSSTPAGRVIVQVRRDVDGPGAVLPGLILHRDDGGFTEAAQDVMNGSALHVLHPARPQQGDRRRGG